MVRLLPVVLGAALAAPPPPPPPTGSPEAVQRAPLDTGTKRIVGVVTFEGSSDYAALLSRSMANALRRRGHWSRGGRSLQQVQTQLGCTNYEPACMARAAELFESELVLYGTLRAQGEAHQLEMFLLDANRGEVQAHVSASIPEYDLSDASIENKAGDLLGQLWPLPTEERVAASPFLPVSPSSYEPADTGRGKLRWGRETPIKRWKWAAFGSSAGTLVLGTVLFALGQSRIRPGGPLEQKLHNEADESLTDGKEGNDIDRSQGGDLCARAMAPPPGEPGAVTNHDVARVCQDARAWTATTNASLAVLTIGLVGTVAFTLVLFTHREPKGKQARVAPRPGGLLVRF